MSKVVTQEDYENAVLLVTGSPEWEIIQQGLYNEIQASQGNALFLKDWDSVKEEKGFIRGLMYCITLREQFIAAKNQAEASANV